MFGWPSNQKNQEVARLLTSRMNDACLSNINTAHWRAVTTPGPVQLPLHRLDHCFASPFVGHRKPEADIYRHVQEQVAVPAGSILFFDDAPENIQAAMSHGWQVHRVDPHGDPVAQISEVLRSFEVISYNSK